MNDAEVRFEREKAEGLVAVGSYLSSAAKRFGVKFESECIPAAAEHYCQVQIVSGAEFLSEKTAAENEAKLDKGWRIACHAKIENAGDQRDQPRQIQQHDPARDRRKALAGDETPGLARYRKRWSENAEAQGLWLYLVDVRFHPAMAKRRAGESRRPLRPP